jgi:hypothetical protein
MQHAEKCGHTHQSGSQHLGEGGAESFMSEECSHERNLDAFDCVLRDGIMERGATLAIADSGVCLVGDEQSDVIGVVADDGPVQGCQLLVVAGIHKNPTRE